MHLRTPACKGAWHSTDQSAAAHGPHEFFPDKWIGASVCPGWTEEEASATAVVEKIRQAPAGYRLEGHPAVIVGIQRLLVPDFPGEGARIEHQLTQLYGVPLEATRLGPGEWRLVTADGTVWDQEPRREREATTAEDLRAGATRIERDAPAFADTLRREADKMDAAGQKEG